MSRRRNISSWFQHQCTSGGRYEGKEQAFIYLEDGRLNGLRESSLENRVSGRVRISMFDERVRFTWKSDERDMIEASSYRLRQFELHGEARAFTYFDCVPPALMNYRVHERTNKTVLCSSCLNRWLRCQSERASE